MRDNPKTQKEAPNQLNMTITYLHFKINNKNSFELGFEKEVLTILRKNGFFIAGYRAYKYYIKNGEKSLLCPILKNNGDVIVVWPTEKAPMRKYPIVVYLFAVTIYILEEISSRKAAEKTRKKFGLEKFSHTTLLRALKYFTGNERFLKFLSDRADPGNEPVHKKKHWTDSFALKARTLFNALKPVLAESGAEDFSAELNYKYYRESHLSFFSNHRLAPALQLK